MSPIAALVATGRHQDRRIAPPLIATGLHDDPVPAEDRRCGVRQSVRRDADCRLSEDVVEDRQAGWISSRHHAACSLPSLAAALGYNEPTIASLSGHKTHNITSRAFRRCRGHATMKLMASELSATPVARPRPRWNQLVWDEFTSIFSSHQENGGLLPAGVAQSRQRPDRIADPSAA